MNIEQKEKKMIFNTTLLPDIFFSEYLNNMPGEYLKIYLYLVFLSKYSKDVKVNDLSKNLSLSVNTISEGIKYLEENNLILRMPQGYVITDLQESALNEIYTLKIQNSQERQEESVRNKERIQLVEYINNTYFQGVMGPTWYSDIDTWMDKYEFDEQVLIALFDNCFKKGALHRNYVQVVAEAWFQHKVKNIEDLDTYYIEQDKLMKMKKDIAKKLGKHSLTQYEEAYIENWITEYKYDMDIIEIALKRTTFKSNVTFEYLNNVIKDWNDRDLRTPAQVTEFLEKRKQQNNNEKELRKKVNKANFNQREYGKGDLDFLIKNQNITEGEEDG